MKKYDLHLHTKYSKCSTSDPAKLLKRAKKRKLDGIAITDHNEIRGALKIAKMNDDPNFEVIVGEEVMTDQCELLVYYVKDRIKPGKYEDVIREVRRQGAVCSVAHPFTKGKRARIDVGFFEGLSRELLPDAMEGFNGRLIFPLGNRKARALAKKLGLPTTGGSDGHFLFEIGAGYTIFEGDLKTAMKNGLVKHGGKKKLPMIQRLLSAVVRFIRICLIKK